MAGFRLEREQRGHFRLPSAGSVFKNDRSFGKSAGQIIDELDLRGLSIGGAQVAAWHGNFIVNAGGAVWMNARCWGRSVSDALAGADVLDEGLRAVFEPVRPSAWGYKRSPYQGRDALILAARFRLERGDEAAIRRAMAGFRLEREQRGHFRLPSAGSVFKNDRSFGKSAGQIIDELGLRGLSVGGAQVAAWHGNFIVNAGGATAADIRALTEAVRTEALRRLGITLEPEILFIGDWG
jgi:UDP-N-acetylmuramate dehydrogenase